VREIAGPRATGSWWAHPKGNEIYRAYRRACAHRDVLAFKLIEGKVTFVHRRIWPTVLRLALDDQRIKRALKAAGAPGAKLHRIVEARGSVALETLAAEWPGGRKALARDKAKLEKLGLVLTREHHTARGAHETELESWSAFAARCGVNDSAVTLGEAMQTLAHRCHGHRHVLS